VKVGSRKEKHCKRRVVTSMVGFHDYETINITSLHDSETINGSTKWNSFKSSNASTWTIWKRELACFCDSCMAGESEACINTEWLEECKKIYLTPIGVHDQR